MELLSGIGYREKKLTDGEMNFAEKTRLIPIEVNVLAGDFGGSKNIPYLGLGYHYLFYEYASFGETFHSDGYLVPLIFGYQVKILEMHKLSIGIEIPLLSDLAFEQVTFSGEESSFKTPYEPAAGLDDAKIMMSYKFVLK